MAMRSQNSFLKYIFIVIASLLLIITVVKYMNKNSESSVSDKNKTHSETTIKNTASNDSAAESLDTLTAELQHTKQQVIEVAKNNQQLKVQNNELIKKGQTKTDNTTNTLNQKVEQLKVQIADLMQKPEYPINNDAHPKVITIVADLSKNTNKSNPLNILVNDPSQTAAAITPKMEVKAIPFSTIPANSTSVHDKLMSALVGRIPIKGTVTDPYPFKIVFSDDTLAANGLRVANLRQMIVSGYAEGDLNLVSVRGWVTSLTFVFEDGTITTTTSNDNNVGRFTKDNALGYLSDPQGNPFIRGKLITNAPAYLGGNIFLGAAQGAANAFAQSQVTNRSTAWGDSSTVTGSPTKFVLGQAGVNATTQAQQWWSDRQSQSFDAVYVAPGQEIVVNFSKEILIDYNPKGRRINYENTSHAYHTYDID